MTNKLLSTLLYKTRGYDRERVRNCSHTETIISPVHLYKMRIWHKRRGERLYVTGGTHGIRTYIYIYTTNESPLNPLCFGNTCRKSQPPNANIILIAIEKYRHYEETLFSFFLSFFRLCGRVETTTPSRLTLNEGGRRAPFEKRPPPPTDRPQSHRNDDSVETTRCEYNNGPDNKN